MENQQVSVRDRIDGDLGAMSIAAAIEKLEQEIADRTVRKTYGGDAGLGDRGSQNQY